jgi:N-carbamoyl-L-amino-acid hydrolase
MMYRRQFISNYIKTILGISFFPINNILNVININNSITINAKRLNNNLEKLKSFGKNIDGGIDRLAFSEADREARKYVIELMKNAGLNVSIDFAANIIGRIDGKLSQLNPIMIGSHIDSVLGGGNYDGQVGSLGAIEVVKTLNENNIQLLHPIEVVIFSNEEGGKTGSRAMANLVEDFELNIVTDSGHTIGEGLSLNGGKPKKLVDASRDINSIAGYLELHIEQGEVLDRKNIDIGIVEGIVGIKRWNVLVNGKTNHAGTTPMNDRRDSLVAASTFIQEVYSIAKTINGTQVATVGRVKAIPGAPNVIPGKTSLSLEIRDLKMDKIDMMFDSFVNKSEEISLLYDVNFQFDQFYVSESAPTDQSFRNVIEKSAMDLGLKTYRMPSGAGHDAQSIAKLAPVGMIFIPSINGVSHSPKEFSKPMQIGNGTNVLLKSLLSLDVELK